MQTTFKKPIIIGLHLFEYIGNEPRDLFELRGRKRIVATKGKIVIVNELVALSYRNNTLFNELDINKLAFIDEIESIENSVKDDTNKDETKEYKLPFVEDLDTLSDEEIKKACDVMKIKKGNKTAQTLKPLLLPFLLNKIAEDVPSI